MAVAASSTLNGGNPSYLSEWGTSLCSMFDTFIVFDLETTGRCWASCWIVQISARVVCSTGLCAPGLKFEKFVMPPSKAKISAEAAKVHGLTRKILKKKNAIDTVQALNEFEAWVTEVHQDTAAEDGGNICLVAYNGNCFDFRILMRMYDILLCGAWPTSWTHVFDPLVVLRRVAGKNKTFSASVRRDSKDDFALRDEAAIVRLPSVFDSLTLTSVFLQLFGTPLVDAHDASADTLALSYIVESLMMSGLLLKGKNPKGKGNRVQVNALIRRACFTTHELKEKMAACKQFEFEAVTCDSDVDDLVLFALDETLAGSESNTSDDDYEETPAIEWEEVKPSNDGRIRMRRQNQARKLSPAELMMPFVLKNERGEIVETDGSVLAAIYCSPRSAFRHFAGTALKIVVVESNRYAAQQQRFERAQVEADAESNEHIEAEWNEAIARQQNRQQQRVSSSSSRSSSQRSSKKTSKHSPSPHSRPSKSASAAGATRKRSRRKRRHASRSRSSTSSSKSPPPRKAARDGNGDRQRRNKKFKPLDDEELCNFLSVSILLGAQQRRSRKRGLWTADFLLGEPFVQCLFTRDRFEQILRYLHFANNEELLEKTDPAFDALGKVRPIVKAANEAFRSSYRLRGYVSGDECSCGFCGRCQFRKSMAHKPIVERFGFNIFAVCCALTSFLYQFDVQCATFLKRCQRIEPRLSHVERVHTMAMLYLLRDCFDSPVKPTIVCDRLYCSLNFLRTTRQLGFDVLGTVRSNGKGMPKKSDQLDKKLRGSAKYWRLKVNDGQAAGATHLKGTVALNYVDSKPFMMLTTIGADNYKWDPIRMGLLGAGRRRMPSAQAASVRRRRNGEIIEQRAPIFVIMYNDTMNGADTFDQNIGRWKLGTRRTRKWTVVIFFWLVDALIENSRIAFNFFAEANGKRKLSAFEFRRQLALELLSPGNRAKLHRLEVELAKLSNFAAALRRAPTETAVLLPDPPNETTPTPPERSRSRAHCSHEQYAQIHNHPRVCSVDGCLKKSRKGCSAHKKVFCHEHYFAVHSPRAAVGASGAKSRRSSHRRPISFSLT
jgi:Transposase IS4/Exonuclease